MSWLIAQIWILLLVAFVLGSAAAWLLHRPGPPVEGRALMSWLLRHNWLWSLLAFLLGAAITWFLLARREQSQAKWPPGAGSRDAGIRGEE